jgi:hypothetical protein
MSISLSGIVTRFSEFVTFNAEARVSYFACHWSNSVEAGTATELETAATTITRHQRHDNDSISSNNNGNRNSNSSSTNNVRR